MGRPLFTSTIQAPTHAVVRVADPESPSYEKWSYGNAFDPDSEEFFQGENVVFEAFLTPEEVASRESSAPSTPGINGGRLSPELSDASSSEGTSSGRQSPTADPVASWEFIEFGTRLPEISNGNPQDRSRDTRIPSRSRSRSPVPRQESAPVQQANPPPTHRLPVSWDYFPPTQLIHESELAASLPNVPNDMADLDWDQQMDDHTILEAPEIETARSRAIPIPQTPRRGRNLAASQSMDSPYSPHMLSPLSVTPRFLNWGDAPLRGTPASPTPAGLARVARMHANGSIPIHSPLRIRQ